MIKTFCTVFQSLTKRYNNQVLLLKTSNAGFSVGARENVKNQIDHLVSQFGDKCPPIHLVFGDLSEEELNSLYNDNKVKANVNVH